MTIVETKFFCLDKRGVFFELGYFQLLHPVHFFSKNVNSASCNYEINTKKQNIII